MSTLKRTRAGSEDYLSRSPSPSTLPNKRIRHNSHGLDAYPSTSRAKFPKYRGMYFPASSPGHSSGSNHHHSSRSTSLYKGYSHRDSPVSLPPLRMPTPRSMPIAKPKASPYTHMTANHFLTQLERCITSDPYNPLPSPPSPAPARVQLPPIRAPHYRGLPESLAALLAPPPSSDTPPATHSASTMSSNRTPQTPRAAQPHQPPPPPEDAQDELSPVRRQLASVQRRLDVFAHELPNIAGPSSQPLLNSPSAFVHASPSPSASASHSSTAALATLTAARADLHDALRDLDDARFALSRQRTEAHMQALLAEARFNQLDGTERRLKDAQDAQARYRQERDAARVEAGALRGQVSEFRAQAARYRGERDLYRADRDAARAQRDRYLVERDAARAYRDQARELDGRVSGENDWCRERDAWGRERDTWGREKDILQGEHRDLRDAVSGLRGENDMLREENRDLREDNEDLRAEVLRLRLAARGPETLLLPGVPRRSSSGSGASHSCVSSAAPQRSGPPFSATSHLPPLPAPYVSHLPQPYAPHLPQPYAPHAVSSSALPLHLTSMNVLARIPSPPPLKEEEPPRIKEEDCW